jgi:tyrosyl-tRNA synthetase
MRFSLSPELLERFPTYTVGLVCVWDADNSAHRAAALTPLLAEAAAGLLRTLGAQRLDGHPAIAAWRAAFERAGINPRRNPPSVQALAERALRGEALPSINPAADIANIVSLKRLVPIGAHDMERLPGDIEVRLARVGDVFTPMGSDAQEDAPPGEPVYATGGEVRTRRWVWRQSDKAKVTPESRVIIFPVDGFTDATGDAVQQATRELAALVQQHLGRTVTTAFVHAQSPTVELTMGGAAKGVHSLGTPEGAGIPLGPTLRQGATLPQGDASPWGARGGHPSAVPPIVRPLAETALATWPFDALLRRGMVEGVIVREELERDLAAGKRLTVYQGFDPTSASLHMGHYLSLRVLRWFQLHGHKVIFLVGDFTGRIGDPTDRSSARQQLTHQQVLENAKTWREQISHILDLAGDNPVEVRFNGDWLDKLSLKDVIELAANVTVQQLIERDMFQARMTEGKPLHLHETLYPLLQGYDSVAMGVDAELGGRDQMFNMMMGRDLVRVYLNKTKHVLMTPLIPGLDGRKMSKTYGNTVDLTEEPVTMFFKLTQVSDQLLPLFLNAFTDADEAEVETVKKRLETESNLQDVRERFAREVTELFHGRQEAERAQAEFHRVVTEGEQRSEVPTVTLPASSGDAVSALDLAMATGLAESRGDARRLIQQGGFEVNDQRIADPAQSLPLERVNGAVVKMGKRGYIRVAVGR